MAWSATTMRSGPRSSQQHSNNSPLSSLRAFPCLAMSTGRSWTTSSGSSVTSPALASLRSIGRPSSAGRSRVPPCSRRLLAQTLWPEDSVPPNAGIRNREFTAVGASPSLTPALGCRKRKVKRGRINMRTIISMGLAFLCLLAAGAEAQQPPAPAMPYASRQVIPIWDGPIPGTVNPAQHESTVEVPGRGVHIVRNVTLPTLTVFPAKPGKTSRTAVVIAPGGGFRVLAIDEEGYPVAEWFSQHGITAIVLKYRLAFTPGTDQEFAPNLLAPPIPHAASGGPPANGLPEEAQ